MGSKDLTHQAELPLRQVPARVAVPIELVHAQRSFVAALALAIQVSGLEGKEIYLPLGIDAGHWSRIVKGEAHFPLDKVRDLCDLVGNKVLAEWVAYQVGCQLVMIESEAERLLRREREATRQALAQVDLLKGLLVGRAQ